MADLGQNRHFFPAIIIPSKVFNTYNLNIEDIFKDEKGKHLKGQTNRIIDFFEKTKILNRTAEFNKRGISPNQDQTKDKTKDKTVPNITMNSNKKLRPQ